MEKLEALLEWGGVKKDVICLVLGGVSLLVSIFGLAPGLPFDPAWVAIILCGVPIILEAVIGLVTAFDIKADVLVSMALIASVIIGEDFAAGEVAFIMQLGSLLEDLTVAKARAGIEKLVQLTPQTARLISGGAEEIIPADAVRKGDRLRVLPGDTVPVDGFILTGQTSINQAVMTGESLPVDKGPGDEVSSGTVNQFGSFDMRAAKVGEDSSIQRMIRLVQSADAGKAKIVGLADRWATWIVVIALSAALLTWLITGEIIRAVTILVVFCPCALVLATPTAIMVGTGKGPENGILIKSAEALETLHTVNTVVLDKTGTLTQGRPVVTDILPADDMDEEGLLILAACLEGPSEHPLATAIVEESKKRNLPVTTVGNFTALHGRGVRATLGDRTCMGGNLAMMEEAGVDLGSFPAKAEELAAQGKTALYFADERQVLGLIAVADTPKPTSAAAVAAFRKLGLDVVMLTGDNQRTADAIGKELGVTEVMAQVLPQDKERKVKELQDQGKKVAMVGDGINDAPALARADVGLAIGAGTDVAIESADIVLMKSDLMDAVAAVELSRATIRNIKENLFWAFFYNSIGIPLAAGVFYALGITDFMLNPMFGAAAMSLSSVCVVSNALRLRFFKSKFRTQAPQSQQTENVPGASAGDDRTSAPVCDQSCPVQLEESNQTTQGGTETMTKTLNIEGMMCAHCVAHVEKALSALGGVTSAKADLEKKQATVTLAAPVSDQELKDAVTEAGYEVVSIQ